MTENGLRNPSWKTLARLLSNATPVVTNGLSARPSPVAGSMRRILPERLSSDWTFTECGSA